MMDETGMRDDWINVPGRLVRGYRVASGPSKDYPYGTLERQRPFFRALGLDLAGCFNGTLNVDISPYRFVMRAPQFTFEKVAWTDLHPPETFSFSGCQVIFQGRVYQGWVYYPHPETKKRHFQNPSLLEVVAEPVQGIAYGDELSLRLNPAEMDLWTV
jgi:hypothetical protein